MAEKTYFWPGMHTEGDLTQAYLLRANAHGTPDKEILIDYSLGMDKRVGVTCKEMNRMVNKTGNALLDLGLKKGDKISWLEDDHYWDYFLTYSGSKTGIINSPLNYRLTAGEMPAQINHCDAEAFIVGEPYIDTANQIRDQLPKIKHYIAITDKEKTPEGYLNFWELVEKASEEDPEERVGGMNPDDLWCIAYTSGTTGTPKGVLHSQQSALAWGLTWAIDHRYNWGDKVLYPMPIFHWGGFGTLGNCMLMCRNAMIMVGKVEPLKMWEIIERERPQTMTLASPIFIAMFNVSDWQKKYDASSLKHISSSGAPIPVPVMEQLLKEFPDAAMEYSYTCSEALFTVANRSMIEEKIAGGGNMVGVPFHGTEISIRDPENLEKELPWGEMGLIFRRGPASHLGYYKAEDITRNCTLPGGWMTVEELGYLDKDGYLYMVDRTKDMVCTGGENVASLEVESVVMQHPDVLEAAVVGIPDVALGEKVAAIVSLKSGASATPEEIVEFCKGRIAGFKRPREVKIIDELPKNPFGKTLKRVLREPYWKGKEMERVWGRKGIKG